MSRCILLAWNRSAARTQDGREPPASGRPHSSEVGRFIRARLPLDQNPPLVREGDRNEIHRQPLGVGADLCARDPVLGPALIAGPGFDLGDLGVQRRVAKRRDDEADIIGKHGRERAGDERAVGQAHDVAAR